MAAAEPAFKGLSLATLGERGADLLRAEPAIPSGSFVILSAAENCGSFSALVNAAEPYISWIFCARPFRCSRNVLDSAVVGAAFALASVKNPGPSATLGMTRSRDDTIDWTRKLPVAVEAEGGFAAANLRDSIFYFR